MANFHPIQKRKRRNGKGSKWITRVRRLAIYLRDHFTCVYCGKDLHEAAPSEIGLDHVVCKEFTKLADGSYKPGTHANENLVTACISCNSRRGSIPVRLFARLIQEEDEVMRRVRNATRRRVPIDLAKSLLSER